MAFTVEILIDVKYRQLIHTCFSELCDIVKNVTPV